MYIKLMVGKSKNDNSSGFAVVELALIIVIVGLITFVGWFVWHSKTNSDNLLASSVKVSSSQPQFKKTSAKTTNTIGATNGPASMPSNSSKPAANSSSSSSSSSSSGSSSGGQAVSSPPLVHPTSSDVQQAELQALTIRSLIEAYGVNYDTYPADLSSGPLINQPGITGASTSTFVAPPGTSFSYTCSKGGPGVCAGYWLSVYNATTNAIIETLSGTL